MPLKSGTRRDCRIEGCASLRSFSARTLAASRFGDLNASVEVSAFRYELCVFVRFVLGRDYTDSSRYLRGQENSLARLLDYAFGGDYYQEEVYEQNFKFLLWELRTRVSM
jgi:hypothetical protein